MWTLGLAGRVAARTRVLSTVQARRYTSSNKFHPSRVASAVTVHLDPSQGGTAELQQAAIDRVEQWLAPGQREGHPSPESDVHDAAVLLVSKSLAAWLDDDGFVSRLLAATGLTHGSPKELSVLAAAVDEVPRYDRRLDFFGSCEGISVLRGNAIRMLPFLWESPKGPNAGPKQGSLEFRTPPTQLVKYSSVDVPLANTLFTTGRHHTLFASRWQTLGHLLPSLTRKVAHTHRIIGLSENAPSFSEDSSSAVEAHLVPVTAPRKVLNSLGNILSQLEIDGAPSPPSQELESVVPLLLQQRHAFRDTKHGEDHPAGGPVGVWALTIPERVFLEEAETGTPALEPLSFERYRSSVEQRLARETADKIDSLLARGCQLHKLLSGGGGWGQKRGLLSLDPQTKLAADEDQDMESFIASFRGETAGSIARPGSYVQFLVEAAYPAQDEASGAKTPRWDPLGESKTVTAVIGTPGAVAGSSAAADSVGSSPSLFGAISSEGVYLSTNRDDGNHGHLATKMDTPRSYMICRERHGK